MLTLVDFRNANHLDEIPPPAIVTTCPQKTSLVDAILDENNRNEIPRGHLVVTVTETGNRDEFVIRYLSQFGFQSIKGLKFGMRGWLKKRYPTK